MLFKILANAEFEADDIDDAFIQLAAHFVSMAADGADYQSRIVGGLIEVYPCKEEPW